MSYKSWFDTHAKKHKAIVDKLAHLSDDEVIAYFDFANMVQKEPDFCPLYKENKKCHEMKELNCYLCACPNFRFDDESNTKQEGKKLFSICSINSKDGAQYIGAEAIHQNCSGCLVPHHKIYIKKNFSRDWLKIMQDVPPID